MPINRKSWEEFQKSGLLWWINRGLHLFGWAIVYVVDEHTDQVQEVYPARVSYRGFEEKFDSEGFVRLTTFMRDQANELLEEAKLQ